jgi:hypothetical protein
MKIKNPAGCLLIWEQIRVVNFQAPSNSWQNSVLFVFRTQALHFFSFQSGFARTLPQRKYIMVGLLNAFWYLGQRGTSIALPIPIRTHPNNLFADYQKTNSLGLLWVAN